MRITGFEAFRDDDNCAQANRVPSIATFSNVAERVADGLPGAPSVCGLPVLVDQSQPLQASSIQVGNKAKHQSIRQETKLPQVPNLHWLSNHRKATHPLLSCSAQIATRASTCDRSLQILTFYVYLSVERIKLNNDGSHWFSLSLPNANTSLT